MIHHAIQQNSDEWMDLRKGKFTASMLNDIFAAPTTATYKKAIYRVVFERLTGEQPESFQNEWMQRGHEMEQLAAERYEMETFCQVEEAGFFELNEWTGCSPDRLVGSDGLLEIKAPAYNTMIDYLISGKLPSIYKRQVHGQLYITGREWCDFMAFHPNIKPLIIRIERDEQIIFEIEAKLNESIEKVKSIINQIK